jgi:hypothetical protein
MPNKTFAWWQGGGGIVNMAHGILLFYSQNIEIPADLGKLSATTSWKTENVSKMVIPRETFSGADAGKQYTISTRKETIQHGTITLIK